MTHAAPPAAATTPATPRLVFLHAVRSEWTKLWSVRSTYWTMLAAVVVTVGYAAAITAAISAQWDDIPAQAKAGMPSPLAFSLFGTQLGQLALAVLGVLVISSEYRTGMIRSTLMAVPQRQRMLLAKLLPFTVVAFLLGEIAAFGSFFVGQAFFAAHGVTFALGDEQVLRTVIGAGLYLAASGLLGLAVGALVRHSAGAIAISVGALFVVPLVIQVLPGDWGADVNKFYPVNAGAEVMWRETETIATDLGAWAGYGIFLASVAVIFVAAAVLLHRRDA